MKKHIVVVGAGMAGLSAAYTLSQNPDLRVTLLESNDHIGGRTIDIAIGKKRIDVGGFIIYPWYKTFHELIKNLDLENQLKLLPKLDIYYKLSRSTPPITHGHSTISLKTKGKMATKLIPTFLNNLNVASPNLTTYQSKTVQEFIRTGLPRITDPALEKYINTICEGYCYPNSKIFQAAFMFPMMACNLFFGDVHTASYFPNGVSTFTKAMTKELKQRGIDLRLNTTVTAVAPHSVHISNKVITADAIIVTHPIDESVPYTRFATVTVVCNVEPTFKNQTPWGGIFLNRSICKDVPILSIIHNGNLYGKTLNKTLTLNIALNQKEATPVADSTYTNRILKELQTIFPTVSSITIESLQYWQRTMPISDPKAVANIIAKQGENDIYYGGDWLGCPSMETALTTGKTAAELFLSTLGKQPNSLVHNALVAIRRKD